MTAMASTAPTPGSAHGPRSEPSREPRLGAWSMWFAIVGAPVAWTLQLVINSILAGNACFPHDVPLAQPAWPSLLTTSSVVEVVALLIGVAAGVVAWRNRRRTRGAAGDGRAAFMAKVGVMSSGLFLVATAVTFAYVLAVPPCAG